jgi:hypothetical protein
MRFLLDYLRSGLVFVAVFGIAWGGILVSVVYKD